jgi:tetratricopeptide (TPR) repeat protein
MRRIRKNGVRWAIAAVLATASANTAAQTGALTKAELKALAEIGAAAEADNCQTLLKKAQPLVDRRQRALPNEVAAALYEMMADCHIKAERIDLAHGLALRGTALAESSPRLWHVRFYGDLQKKRYGDAAATLDAMTQGHGAALNHLPLPWLWALLQQMKEAGADAERTRILKLLASEAYAPAETFGSNDGFRFVFAQDRLAAGDTASAGPVVRELEDPHNIAMASLDPRMRGYLAEVDVRAAAEKMLARHREWIAREPDRLRPLIAAAENLRQLGRAREALDLLKTAEPRLDKLTGEEDSDRVNWYWNEVARNYEFLRRPDEVVEAYRNGMKASEDGVPNVSQLINLALAQNRLGRPGDALATLAARDLSAKGASPYGIMLYRRARACALHLSGRGAEAAADIAYVKSHEKDAPGAVTDLYLCLGDMEAAAASAIRRLDDPELRPDMLLELSDYDLAPPPLPTDRIARNLEALKTRADVQAAIKRAGGTRRFNVAEI